ncbi:TIGR03086 family metal-binding protein [Rhodococcus sp. NPDC058505]|uniref:TIGR03086 family metal-binding protein n=1 Tax=unclassified Rhodococcus (in: high G+C Gram-positive bacteria) TaxID=192944 RepID=UPI003661527A
MTAEWTTGPLADPVPLLERAIAYTDGALRSVTDRDLDRPTPCSGWDLRMLLAHMNESLTVLEEVVLDRAVVLVPASIPDAGTDPVAALHDRACRMMSAWRGSGDRGAIRVGGVPLPSDIAAAAGALEVAVHGWDVAAACGVPREIPGGLADELLWCARLLVSDADRPGRFAAPRRVSASAGPGERLLAFLGR